MIGFHRLRHTVSRVELQNHVIWFGRRRRLWTLGVFSRRTHRLVNYRSILADKDFPIEMTRLRMTRQGMMACHRLGRHVWSEVWPEADPRGVRQAPFAYAEIAYLLRRLDWDSRDAQFFPALPLRYDRERPLDKFFYAFKICKVEPGVGHVIASLMHDNPFGRQGVSSRMDVALKERMPLREVEENLLTSFVALPPTEARKIFLSFSRRVFPRFSSAPKKNVPTRTIRVTKPLVLTLTAPRHGFRPSTEAVLFSDLFALGGRKISSYGARRFRLLISESFLNHGVCTYVYNTVFAHSFYERALRFPTFSELRLAVRALWRKVLAEKHEGHVVFCYGTDCFCVPLIFRDAKSPPPLVLLLPPRFTEASRISDGLNPNESELLRIGGYPETTLREMMADYGAPILFLGERRLFRNLRAVCTPVKGTRTLRSLHWQENAPGQGSDTRVVDAAVAPEAVEEIMQWWAQLR